MKPTLIVLLCLATMSSYVSAHEPPSTPADPGPVPGILFEYPVLAVYPDTASLFLRINRDTTLSYVENNYGDMAKSVQSSGTWTWANDDFCMYVDGHILCYKLEDELTPGLVYETQMRLLNAKGEEEAALPVKLMLVRSVSSAD